MKENMKEIIWHGMEYIRFLDVVTKRCRELSPDEKKDTIPCYCCEELVPKRISEITQGACVDCRADLSYNVVPRDPHTECKELYLKKEELNSFKEGNLEKTALEAVEPEDAEEKLEELVAASENIQ
ncbi:hypothetical protein JXB27_01690 [Candidatus Woesearchaeota archaeon]|nr:hypothetical protein [Candidatus Woesearchaeota archaeon]